MIAEPRGRRPLSERDDKIELLPADDGSMVMDCEVVSPPSAAGRHVYVRVPPGKVDDVMRAARRAGIRLRDTPL